MRTIVFVGLALLWCSTASAQDAPALTPRSLEAALAAKPQGPDAEKLAERIRAYFGAEALQKGSAAPKIEDLMVAWAVEVPPPAADAPPARVVSDAVTVSGTGLIVITPVSVTAPNAGSMCVQVAM